MTVRTQKDRDGLRSSGLILADTLERVAVLVRPGVTTAELNVAAEAEIVRFGARPSFKGYRGFPCGLCISVNEEVVHGIPSDRKLREGDVVSLDLGVDWRGYFTDAARTVVVGVSPSRTARRLIATAERALQLGIEQAKPGNTTGHIGEAIAAVVDDGGFAVVRDLVGHGVGRAVHEEPSVPNIGRAGEGTALEEGMVLAIEPMVSAGRPNVRQGADGQVFITMDGSLAAHVEHTIIVGNPPEVVTRAARTDERL